MTATMTKTIWIVSRLKIGVIVPHLNAVGSAEMLSQQEKATLGNVSEYHIHFTKCNPEQKLHMPICKP